jgi:DNA topoisomerase II
MVKQTAKTVEERFKKLTDIEHVLLRPGMYIGSTQPHTAECWVFDEATKKMIKRPVTWNPGLQKLFDEVISNSVDHSKRDEGKHLDTIRVEIDRTTGEISVYDNGGIPVVMHKEHDMYVPTMLFAELKAGSNFDDSEDRDWVGTNGVGASLVNIFSTKFRVETCDGMNQFRQDFANNNHDRKEPKIREGEKTHTKITFTPDYERLGCTLDEDNYAKILKRIVDVAACNPNIKVYANGERIHVRSFKDYIELYADEFEFEELASGWKFGVAHSDDGFQHISFVNGSETIVGGSHVDFLGLQLSEKLREFFKKKHKVDIKPSEIRQHITLFIDARVINPRYDSQTKEKLINEMSKDLRDSCEISDKLVRKLTQSHIIQSVLDWVEAKALAAQNAELRKINKHVDKADPRKVEKFSDANEKKDRHKCVLLFTEGDSAAKSVQSGRGKSPYIGSFPLKGKPLNVSDVDPKKILENEEIKKILTITGLKLGEKVTSIAQLRFGKFGFTTDADVDGAHIQGLLSNLFYRFWPELFDLGVIHIFRTPLIKVFQKKADDLWFYTEREFKEWEAKEGQKIRGWSFKYFKGLGTSTSKEFAEYLNDLDTHLVKLAIETPEDRDLLDMAFNGQRADDRKVWLETPAEEFDF